MLKFLEQRYRQRQGGLWYCYRYRTDTAMWFSWKDHELDNNLWLNPMMATCVLVGVEFYA